MTERTIKILLVDESEARVALLKAALRDCGYHQVVCVRDTSDVLDSVYDSNPDVILIDVESPTRDTLEHLTLVQERQPKPVVMFTQDQSVQTIQSAIESGVTAYVTSGISSAEVAPAIEAAMITFRRFQELRQELAAIRETLSDTKLVHRAKSYLMEQRHMSEEQAYHFLRRQAMNQKIKLVDIAKSYVEDAGIEV